MSTNTDDQDYSARRIHQSLGGTTAFFQGYTIGGSCCSSAWRSSRSSAQHWFQPPSRFLSSGSASCSGLVLGVLHKVKPSYLWLTEWLAARLGWAVKNKEYTHGEDNSEVRYLTRVGQVFPHAIERSDGALVGAMKVEPANMALEDDDAWAKAVDSLSEFVNATIDFPVKFYITSREVDQDDVVRDHQRRLGDADVRSRPVLKRLLDGTLRPTRIRTATSTPGLRPSANTTSSPPFVTLTSSNSTKPAIASWPTSPTSLLLGRVFGRFQSDGLSDAERDRLKEDKLESRLGQLRRGGSSLYRCSMSPVDAYDLTRVTKEYWTGHTEEYGGSH